MKHSRFVHQEVCGQRVLLSQSSISKLQRIQNAAIRLLTGRKKFDRNTLVRKSLHWFPAEKRVDFRMRFLVYFALHDQTPEYIRDKLQEVPNLQTLCPSLQPVSSSSLEQTQRLWERDFRHLALLP